MEGSRGVEGEAERGSRGKHVAGLVSRCRLLYLDPKVWGGGKSFILLKNIHLCLMYTQYLSHSTHSVNTCQDIELTLLEESDLAESH